LGDKDLLIVDEHNPLLNTSADILHIASGTKDEGLFSKLVDVTGPPIAIYLPLWSEEELEHYDAHIHSIPGWQEQYFQFGGAIRWYLFPQLFEEGSVVHHVFLVCSSSLSHSTKQPV
jgi:hypothetical protein